VDIENTPVTPGDDLLDCGFAFAPGVSRIAWEVAGGSLAVAPPIERFRHLRWIALEGEPTPVLFGARDTALASVDEGGRLTAHAVMRPARFRLAFPASLSLPDDVWRFGWSLVPFDAVATTGRGDVTLPTFARVFDVQDPAVAVLGAKPADDGVGVIVYVQELAGVGRIVEIGAGLLAFDTAVRTDLAERDLGTAEISAAGAARLPISAGGYAAVRLLGVRVSG
jgi:hypothetical protein